MDKVVFALALAGALGSGAMGGLFFAFSTFVIDALKRLPPAQGLAAMQSINVTAVRPPLMALLFGTAAICLALAVLSLFRLDEAEGAWLLAGSLAYLLGNVGVTAAFNVPRNSALARLDAEASEGHAYWQRYQREWTAYNHVRTLTGLAACALLVVGLTEI
jgi:uncharacterized membrane protein